VPTWPVAPTTPTRSPPLTSRLIGAGPPRRRSRLLGAELEGRVHGLDRGRGLGVGQTTEMRISRC
jgi:hypothetical protein